MRLSRLVGLRLKETPSEATSEGEALLLRGGYIRVSTDGNYYGLLPAGVRVVRNIERLLCTAIEQLGGQETNLSATVACCARDLNSYTQLPFTIYRTRVQFAPYHSPLAIQPPIHFLEKCCGYHNFIDVDAFFATPEEALAGHAQFRETLLRIFTQVGLTNVIPVSLIPYKKNDFTPEELVLRGGLNEDVYAEGAGGAWQSLLAGVSSVIPGYPEPPRPLEKVHTPGTKTIRELADFLKIEPRQTAKVVLYSYEAEDLPIMVLIRGDRMVNEGKILTLIGINEGEPDTEAIAQEKFQAAGIVPGFASPLGIDPKRCRIFIDHSVRTSNNLVTGANEPNMHYNNFNLERDLPGMETVDVAMAAEGDLDSTGKPFSVFHGTCLGGVYWSGTEMTEGYKMTFRDREGTLRNPILVSFNADIARIFLSIVEQHHDQYGPLWPAAVAPWAVHICALRLDTPGVREAAEGLYEGLRALGVEALYDDRNAQPGVQFAEADLIGAPLRVTVGERGLKQGAVEWKRRATGEAGTVPVEGAARTIAGWIAPER